MPPETDARTVTVLSVSPIEEDHIHLHEILNGCEWTPCSGPGCRIQASFALAAALTTLREQRFPIVVCERDLSPGSWRDLLEQAVLLPNPPLLIVTSKFADERLWAEALNLGAYDVLAKPFNSREVCPVVDSAWRHWRDHHEAPARARQGSTAAGLRRETSW